MLLPTASQDDTPMQPSWEHISRSAIVRLGRYTNILSRYWLSRIFYEKDLSANRVDGRIADIAQMTSADSSAVEV